MQLGRASRSVAEDLSNRLIDLFADSVREQYLPCDAASLLELPRRVEARGCGDDFSTLGETRECHMERGVRIEGREANREDMKVEVAWVVLSPSLE